MPKVTNTKNVAGIPTPPGSVTSQPPLTGTTFLAGSSDTCQHLPKTGQDPPSGFPQGTPPTLPPKLTPVIRGEVTEGPFLSLTSSFQHLPLPKLPQKHLPLAG